MTAMLDFRTIRDFVAYPFRFIFGADSGEMGKSASRAHISMRWRRGEDGKLESRWQRDE